MVIIYLQCIHNDFEHAKKTEQGFLIIVTEAEPLYLWVEDGFHKNVNVPMEENRVNYNFTEPEIITISTQAAMSVGHGYLQRALTAWITTLFIIYRMLLIPQDHDLMDVVSFAYGWRFCNSDEPRKPS